MHFEVKCSELLIDHRTNYCPIKPAVAAAERRKRNVLYFAFLVVSSEVVQSGDDIRESSR